MKLRLDKIALADNSISEYGVIERNDFVMIIPRRDDFFLLVQQYRYPIRQWTWEFPQGSIEEGESTQQAAQRELLEETGAQIHSLHYLGKLYEAAGFSTHSFEVFIGDVNEQSTANPDLSETGINARWFDKQELRRMIINNQINDAPSLAGWALATESEFGDILK